MPSSLSSSSCFELTSQLLVALGHAKLAHAFALGCFLGVAASPIVTSVFGEHYRVPATFTVAFVQMILHDYMVEASQLAEWVFVKLSSFSLSTSPAL